MRLQRINYAEAIIEPFYDGSDSNRPDNKISQLVHYDVTLSDQYAISVKQDWNGVRVRMDGGAPRRAEMTRACDVNISDFNVFRVFGSIPEAARQTIRAKIDGQWVTLCEGESGIGGTDEYNYPLSGNRLQGLSIIMETDGSKDSILLYEWLGLSHTEREAAMNARHSEFTPDWPDMLLDEGTFEPEIGIMFGREDVEALRRRVHTEPLKPLYDDFLKKTEEYLSIEPEKYIGTYIPKPDGRWVRKGDMDKPEMAHAMGALAFVGLIERRADMMKMAVRMALSVSHCEYWTESIMGALPGCAWHHRCFTEEVYCRGCAQVLDWAGGFMTSYAREIILDAIIMKGLPRLESDFKRQEYIRGMNQGIVFSSGRIFALMACAHFYPRYRDQVLEAERDINEMIGNYIMPDGGTPEGPVYWNYTFSQIMPILHLLSRFHGKPFSSMATPALKQTGRYGLSMLSITEDGAGTIGLNDGHNGQRYLADLMSSFYALTGDKAYLQLTALTLKESKGSPYLFIIAPDEIPSAEPLVQEGFSHWPAIGQTHIVRRSETLGRTALHFYSGLADVGHYHMDKGSLVLETEQEALLFDRGVLSYAHPDTMLCGLPEYHNLLYPELSGARPRQKPTRDGAYLLETRFENGVFETAGDITKAWDDERVLKDVRRIVSDCPEIFQVEDSMTLSENAPAMVLFNTLYPCEVIEGGVIVHGETADVLIQAEDWTPETIECVSYGVDDHERPVNRIALHSAAACEHHLTTQLTLVKK